MKRYGFSALLILVIVVTLMLLPGEKKLGKAWIVESADYSCWSPEPSIRCDDAYTTVRFLSSAHSYGSALKGFCLGSNSFPRFSTYEYTWHVHSPGRYTRWLYRYRMPEHYSVYLYCRQRLSQWVLVDWRQKVWPETNDSRFFDEERYTQDFVISSDAFVIVVGKLTKMEMREYASMLRKGQHINRFDLPGPYQIIE